MRILLADDQASVRSALRLLLEQSLNGEIVGECADATSLLQTIAHAEPDVILLDWELPGLPAVQLMRLLRFEKPGVSIIALSSRPEASRQAVSAGVDAFVSKNAPPEILQTAVKQLEVRGTPANE